MSPRPLTPVTPEREAYLAQVARTRCLCDQAFSEGFVINPEFAEAANRELLKRLLIPLRKEKLTGDIIEVDSVFAAEWQLASPIERWYAAKELRG